MWKRPLAYLLFILGFLTVTFFRTYKGELIPYPFLFWLVGLLFFISGYFLLRSVPTNKVLKFQKAFSAVIDNLKSNGEKINVDLSKCEIKENSYTETKNVDSADIMVLANHIESYIKAFNALSENRTNSDEKYVQQSVIVFRYENPKNGQREVFISRVIPKDKVTLEFYLSKQKETILYVDKSNRNSYYFNLDFLNF